MIAGAAFVNKKCQLSSVFRFCNHTIIEASNNQLKSFWVAFLMNIVANGGLVSLGRIEHGMGLESLTWGHCQLIFSWGP